MNDAKEDEERVVKPLPKLNRSIYCESQDKQVVSSIHPVSMDKVIVAEKKSTNKKITLAMLGSISFIALILIYWNFATTRSTSILKDRVTIGEVESNQFAEFAPVTGSFIPQETIYLDTVEGGRVMAVYIEDGANVDAGDPVIKLHNVDLELQVMNYEAQYTEQLSNLARAQTSFDQSVFEYDRQLMNSKLQMDLTRSELERRLPRTKTGVSQAEIDRLRAELEHQEKSYQLIAAAKDRDIESSQSLLEQLKASISQMQQGVTLLRDSLDGLTLRASRGGQVSGFNLQVGEVLSPGNRIAQIDDLERFKVRAIVDEFYLNRIQIGQRAEGVIGSQTFSLIVSKIYPNVRNRQFEIDLAIDGDSFEKVRRGQTLRLRIALSESQQTLTVPNGPHYDVTGGQWVFVLDTLGQKATKRMVNLGKRNQEHIEVLSGLGEGERIITSSYEGLEDNDIINLK